MAAPLILVAPKSMTMRNRADMARFPHAERLRIIKFDPLESIKCSRFGDGGCRIASPQHLPLLFGRRRGMGQIYRFRGWEHDIGRHKTGGGCRATCTEEGVDRR